MLLKQDYHFNLSLKFWREKLNINTNKPLFNNYILQIYNILVIYLN